LGYPHFRKPPYRNQDKHRPSGPQVILDSDWRWHPRYALLPSVTSAISNSGAHCMYPSLSSNVAGKSIMSSDDRKHIENLHSYTVYIYTHTNYIYSGFPISMFDYQMVHASCELNYVHTILPAKCCDPKTITVLALPLQLPVDPFAYDVYSPQQRSCGLVVDEIDNLVCTLFMLGTSVAKKNTPQGHL